MKKILQNPIIQNHIIPTLIVGGWILALLAIALITEQL
jgi:hypothetical protein